tara:strand:+ start:30 stop:413 length:384 start_codon:yes stop_codon:yes gene_type:complete
MKESFNINKLPEQISSNLKKLLTKKHVWLMIGIITVEAIAQSSLCRSCGLNGHGYTLLGVLLYGLIAVLYYFYLKISKDKLAVAQTYWTGGSTVLVLLAGSLLFGQKLTTREWIGIVIVFIGGLIMS